MPASHSGAPERRPRPRRPINPHPDGIPDLTAVRWAERAARVPPGHAILCVGAEADIAARLAREVTGGIVAEVEPGDTVDAWVRREAVPVALLWIGSDAHTREARAHRQGARETLLVDEPAVFGPAGQE